MRVLCNVSEPSLTKLATLVGMRVTSVSRGMRHGSLTLTCKLDGVKVTVREARQIIYDYIVDNDIVLVNHQGHVIEFNQNIKKGDSVCV